MENSSQIPWLLLVVLLYRSAWWVVGDCCYCCCCYCYSCYCCYSSLLDKNICICIFVHGGSNCVALFLPANYIPSDSTRPKELKPLHRVQGIPTQELRHLCLRTILHTLAERCLAAHFSHLPNRGCFILANFALVCAPYAQRTFFSGRPRRCRSRETSV